MCSVDNRTTVSCFVKSNPNPPSNLVIRTEMSGLWSIPDHQQGIRCKAPRSDTTEPYGAMRCKEERSKATRQMMH